MSDRFSFTIPLAPTGDEGSEYRVKNAPNEFQRPHLVDQTSPLEVQGDLVEVLHGRLSPDGAFATLLIFEFHFLSTKLARRFLSASIELKFADIDGQPTNDPEVLRIAPQGHFTMRPTENKVDVKRSANASVQAGAGPANANVGFAWEVTESSVKEDQTSLTGSIRFVDRTWGRKNGVRWALLENSSKKTGIPTLLRAPVLLQRQDESQFLATVKVRTEVDMKSSIERMFGKKEEVDPVFFDPLREPTSDAYDLDNLGIYKLKDLSTIMSTTVHVDVGND